MESATFTFPAAYIIEMDGLMLNSEVIFQAARQAELVSLGYQPLPQTTYLQLVGRSNDQAEKLLLQLLGADFAVDRFRTGWTARWQTLAAQGIPLKPGLEPLLDWLDQMGISKAVGTSSNDHEAHISLKSTGLWSRFEAIVTVDKAGGQGKPAPDIFLTAAKALNISPMQCLVLEDSNAGVQAAIAAGMGVIMVPDLQTPTEFSQQQALAIVPSLHEVLAQLQSRWQATLS